jgi:hypothetical protein
MRLAELQSIGDDSIIGLEGVCIGLLRTGPLKLKRLLIPFGFLNIINL